MHTDTDLIASTKAGNNSAFRLLVKRHESQVRSTVVGMLGDTVEADDVTQEVFIRFFRSIDKFREESTLSTYLTRIAINLSLNEIKKRQRRQKWLGNLQKDSKVHQLEDQYTSPERSELKDLIRKALLQLEPDFRTVVVLRLVEGYSVKETAEILDLPIGTIASRLARAQKKLKKILDKWL